MKTPKEKAQELFDKFYIVCQEFTEEIQCSIQAKQCALIAVNEIKKSIPYFEYDNHHQLKFNIILTQIEEFWLEVKREIEKL